ncbi:type VI secretion system Vgr family protein [Sorangium sp. So ce131]|uniref:type VI secretion system Vgr family protein n=1 Tax=Sorangium sp. So ce131 TaxID=3133282 RepID=UPI003F5E2077
MAAIPSRAAAPAMNDLISISSSVLPPSTRVVGFRGVEAISTPYEIEIFFSFSFQDTEADDFDLADMIGGKAVLTLDRATDRLPPFVFAGIFANVELLHELDGRALVRGLLVPKLWQLRLSTHSRIFTRMAVPDVIKSVLEENGLGSDDYELRLGNYEVEEHICQYRESDFDFLSRWMEREGIYYFFEHRPEGDRLIVCDDRSYPEDPIGEPVRYHPQLGRDHSAGASFRTFTCRHRTLPAKIKLKDYDYARPNLEVAGSARISTSGVGEVSLYGERFFTPAAGDRLARLRAEEMLARQVLYHAAGTRTHLRTGATFALDDHPRASFNARYLTIEAHHYGNQSGGSDAFKELIDLPHEDVYFVEITAIPAKTQFRAESRAPWPRIYGYENGIVDGALDSEYAQIDGQGRYSVKFNFDESSLKAGNASTFVRMMQPHGGGIEGFHFPLRKGTEVVFSFLGGDPDRPVISGVVPNALTPSPVTSGNHTKNVIQTGGRNRLELEDKSGQQRVTLSTPYSNTYLRMGAPNDEHELIVKTDDNTLLDAGKTFDLTVGQNGGGSWNCTVKDAWITHVQSGVHEFYVDASTSYTEVKGDTWLHVTDGNLFQDVDKGTMKTTVKGDTTTTVKTGNYTVSVDTANTKIDTKSGKTEILSKGDIVINSESGQITIDAKSGKMTIHAAQGIDIKSEGDISVSGAQKWYQYTTGDWFKFNSSSGISVTVGLTSDTKIGIANENFIGGKISTTLGGFAEFNAAYKFAMTAAVSMEYKFGAALCINAAAEVTAKVTAVKEVAAAIEHMPAWMGMSAVRYSLSGLHTLM